MKKSDTSNQTGEDLVQSIYKVLKGTKPVEHAQVQQKISNKKLEDPSALHKSYDIAGDLDPNKIIDDPGVKFDFDNDEDDLEYIKHKMGMDTPGEKHEADIEKDEGEKNPKLNVDASSPGNVVPEKRISFSDYMKNQDLRREHLRRAKINKAYGNT